MKKLYGVDKKHSALYLMLIELMANTRNHASTETTGTQPWWASVYYQAELRKVCFTFVDTGVGIMKSVGDTIGTMRRVAKAMGIMDNCTFLQKILDGELRSRTGLENRGKGIPKIYGLSQNGIIENLTVITNDVYANVSSGEYKSLKKEFRGTLWNWEISASER